MTMVEEMVQQRDEVPRELPPLPTWESTPEDLEAATRTIKSALAGASRPPAGPWSRSSR